MTLTVSFIETTTGTGTVAQLSSLLQFVQQKYSDTQSHNATDTGRVTTCLENLKMEREFDSCQGKSCWGKLFIANFVLGFTGV